MVGCEASVVGGVPVFGCYDEIEGVHELVDDGDDFVASVNSECAAREEVVLYVDDEESFH